MESSEQCMKKEKLKNKVKMREVDLEDFSNKIGVKFNEWELLCSALTHRSYINETEGEVIEHNERLEFLGDAVLELVISKYLFSKYPDRPEGDLTSFRAATVKTESLAQTSRDIGVGEYLRMSKGEESTGGRDKDYLLANAFEAILGAIYIDSGYEECEKFIFRWLVPKIDKIVKERSDIDSKTKFQELAQRLLKKTPDYRLEGAIGPDHEKIFRMSVFVGDKKFGTGEGSSKQRAEEDAAKEAIKNIRKLDKSAKIA